MVYRDHIGSDFPQDPMNEPSNQTERIVADVLEYSFSKDAKSLVFAVSSKKEETNGAFMVTPNTDGAPVTLLS